VAGKGYALSSDLANAANDGDDLQYLVVGSLGVAF
jgi:hypothetical protein